MLQKVKCLDNTTLDRLSSNLDKYEVNHAILGSSIVFPIDLPMKIFEGCWGGYEGNIKAEPVTDYDEAMFCSSIRYLENLDKLYI